MNNFQLYRTNVRLSGQVAWNLVLQNNDAGKLEVRYFDISPLSPYVNYKYNQNRECLKYTHQENLRTLYKEIKGQFYDACIDPQLKTIYPIIRSENGKVKTYDDSLEMGCSRISYDRYKKQLQYLCPLWLEDFSEEDTLCFRISINNKSGESIAAKTLYLSKNGSTYNDRFVDYLNNYIKSIRLDKSVIGNDLLNIDIKNNNANIQGLDIVTGKVITKDISNLVTNLISRERPLMETDFLLIDNYHTSEMICKQLFNFNLVFDVSDIISPIIDVQLKDRQLYISVDTYCLTSKQQKLDTNTILTKKGFSSDYKHNSDIRKVLKYLRDYDYIKTTHINKLSPDICHWTLTDNEDYIFNLYDGFGYEYRMFYGDAPNYWETNVNQYPNTITWCRICPEGLYPNNDLNNALVNYISNINLCTTFDSNNTFFGLTKFDNSDLDKNLPKEFIMNTILSSNSNETSFSQDCTTLAGLDINRYVFIVLKKQANISEWPKPEDLEKSYPITIYLSNNVYNSLPEEIRNSGYYNSIDNADEDTYSDFTSYVILERLSLDHYFTLITYANHKDLLSYKFVKKVIELLHQEIFEKDNFKTIKSIFKQVIEPNIICIDNSIKYYYVSSPSTISAEIDYVKDKNGVKLIRYDGKIKPEFIDLEDTVRYQVKQCTIDTYKTSSEYSIFNTVDNRLFLPYFPSLKYYNLKVLTEPICCNEYKWYNDSLIYNLSSNIEANIYSRDNKESYYSNEELIEIVIKSFLPNLTTNHYQYIRSLYNADVSYEYDVPAWNKTNNRFEYIYTIKLKLK